jgi:hypothetical protein
MNRKPVVTHRISILLAVLLAGCQAATPAPTITPIPSSPTAPPTATPPPTPTAAPPTSTPPPPTPAPPTATASPTATATPGPGDTLYSTQFDNFMGWKASPMQTQGKMTTAIRDGQLVVTIRSADTYGYVFYTGDYPASSDQTIETVAERMGGTNRNNLSLICRVSERGWYEFNVTSGGLYNIMRYDSQLGNWTMLASGGSGAINLQDKPNKLRAVCQGDNLTLVVNDQFVAAARDGALTRGGQFGLSVSTFSIGNVSVGFDYLTVKLPAPGDAPAAAATVKAPAGGGTNPQVSYDGTWNGTTAQGQMVIFSIESNTISLVTVGFNCATGGNDLTIDSPAGGAVRASAFTVNLFDGSILAGRFTSGNSAAGTLTCNGQSVPWNATR